MPCFAAPNNQCIEPGTADWCSTGTFRPIGRPNCPCFVTYKSYDQLGKEDGRFHSVRMLNETKAASVGLKLLDLRKRLQKPQANESFSTSQKHNPSHFLPGTESPGHRQAAHLQPFLGLHGPTVARRLRHLAPPHARRSARAPRGAPRAARAVHRVAPLHGHGKIAFVAFMYSILLFQFSARSFCAKIGKSSGRDVSETYNKCRALSIVCAVSTAS